MKVDAAMLVAYLDGELDSFASAQVERALAEDPKLSATLASLRRVDAVVEAAFDPVAAAPLPPLAAIHLRRPPRHPAKSTPGLALAAGIAGLVIGFGAGQFSSALLPPAHPVAAAAIEAELPDVLESKVSGTIVAFSDPIQGVTGIVKPVGTFKIADGSFCRAYEAQASHADETVTSRGIACRDPNGRWLKRVQVNVV